MSEVYLCQNDNKYVIRILLNTVSIFLHHDMRNMYIFQMYVQLGGSLPLAHNCNCTGMYVCMNIYVSPTSKCVYTGFTLVYA